MQPSCCRVCRNSRRLFVISALVLALGCRATCCTPFCARACVSVAPRACGIALGVHGIAAARENSSDV
eukprot:1529597-Alexandrium_andersonii.AAC.1